MSEIEIQTENKTRDIKLYSAKAIGGATFLGGPIAAGYLIGENFKALKKPTEGRYSLIISIVGTILLFGTLFMIPEQFIDKIPRQLIPIIYTAGIWGFVEWKHGDILKQHKANNNQFFSGWRAAGIGLLSLIILFTGIFAYTYLSTDDTLYEKYDTQIAEFSKNENETLVFYDNLNTETNASLLQELDNISIPKWKENIEIIKKTNEFENLPPELLEQNKTLLKYAELRVAAFILFRKAIDEDNDKYTQQLEHIHQEIDNEIDKLNK